MPSDGFDNEPDDSIHQISPAAFGDYKGARDNLDREIAMQMAWASEISMGILPVLTARATGLERADVKYAVRCEIFIALLGMDKAVWTQDAFGPTVEYAVNKLHTQWHEFYDPLVDAAIAWAKEYGTQSAIFDLDTVVPGV